MNTVEIPVETVRVKPPIIPTPRSEGVTGRKPIILAFHVGKDFLRKFEIPQSDMRKNPTAVYHLYPTLGEWCGRIAPDGVNPRSHDPECLKSPVAKQIESTIINNPEDFYLANRGSTLIAESLAFDPKTGDVEIIITDPDNQGLADGATTDAVLAKIQTRMAREVLDQRDATYKDLLNAVLDGKTPSVLQNGRIHLEVFVGLEDRARIANLVQGRNTSRQVKGWSMADFKGAFDWIKEILEADNSEFKGKVGYEENSGKNVSVLDVMSIATLFHPEFDEKENGSDKAPVIAYANKGRMDGRLADEVLLKGYQQLSPLMPDFLRLYDYVYVNFEAAYEKGFGARSRLGRRQGVTAVHDSPIDMEFTGLKSNYIIPNGFLFPLLASFRALISHRANKTSWRLDPFEFFDKYGRTLVVELMEQVEAQGGNPNVAGKRKLVYTALHKQVKILLAEELEERAAKRANN